MLEVFTLDITQEVYWALSCYFGPFPHKITWMILLESMAMCHSQFTVMAKSLNG